MIQRYRLTAKPGVAQAGRYVQTQNKPIIIVNDQKIPKEQQPQKVIKAPHKMPQVRIKGPNVVPNRAGRLKHPANSKISRAREKQDNQLSQYRNKVETLKNVGVGRILIMVACGPSILEVDLAKLKNHPLIDMMSINKPDLRIHPTKYWVFCDQSQYKNNQGLFESFPNIVINAWSVKARHKNQILIRNKSGKGFSKNLLQGFHIGRSTTFANMQTAYWMNYDKVFIFGCDMCKVGDLVHAYGRNPDVEPDIRVSRFKFEADNYEAGAAQLSDAERAKFVFCSSYNKWPFVDKFQKLDHRVAVDHILELAEKMKNGI